LRKFKRGQQCNAELARVKGIVNEASLVVFIFLLRRFFSDGTNAAIQAVDTFKELGIKSFQIGSKEFSGRNKNVMKGEKLAEKLLKTITDEDLKLLIMESKNVTQIINRYKPFIEN
jgi:hypothetical protein